MEEQTMEKEQTKAGNPKSPKDKFKIICISSLSICFAIIIGVVSICIVAICKTSNSADDTVAVFETQNKTTKSDSDAVSYETDNTQNEAAKSDLDAVSNETDNYNQGNTKSSSGEAKELSADNILSYVFVDVSVTNIEDDNKDIFDTRYRSKKATVNINISPRISGKFNNATLKFNLNSSSKNWGSSGTVTLNIPVDGKTEKTMTLSSLMVENDSVDGNPKFNFEVLSATGTFVEE